MLRYLLFATLILGTVLIAIVGTISVTRSEEPVSFIYYLTNENGRLNVFRMNMDGSDKRAITFLCQI